MPRWIICKTSVLEAIAEHENDLIAYAVDQLQQVPGLRLIGTPAHRVGAMSFVLEGIHAQDVGTILDEEGIAVRTGHHCTMPLMERFGVPATVRAALACYNTHEEIDALVRGLQQGQEVLWMSSMIGELHPTTR